MNITIGFIILVCLFVFISNIGLGWLILESIRLRIFFNTGVFMLGYIMLSVFTFNLANYVIGVIK